MRNFFTLTTLILLIGLTFQATAQTGTIRGFVYNKANGEPLPFVNVYLDGSAYGGSTDDNGYYSIAKVPPGTYILKSTYLGFDTISESIEVKKGQIITKKIFLKASVVEVGEVDIYGDREAENEVSMSVQKIKPSDIKRIPAVGEPDLVQYLQVVPGVIFTGDQGGQLYIRGGSPVQNKVLLDGMVVYNPFHSIGLFSVFDTDIIRNADIYTGGFDSEYGGRISSVMDITTRDGNKNRISGKAGLSTFGAKALLEGPIYKAKELGGSTGSFILSAKTSYLEQSSQALYTYIDEDGLPFNFTDLYGKASFNGANGSKLNLFGFSFQDQVQYQAVSDLNWESFGGGGNFLLVPQGSPVLVEGNFAYSTYDISLEEENLSPRSSSIDGFNLGLAFNYFLPKDEIKYGIEVLGFSTDFEFFNTVGRRLSQNQNTTEFAGYFKYRWKIGKKGQERLIIEPSFRGHYYASLSHFSPEPRIGAKYNLTKKIRLKAAGGFYSQNLISANSDRDVVNLFYGFLSGPDNLQEEFQLEDGGTRPVNHDLQKARHMILGAEFDVAKNITLNVEGYRKEFTQLTNINRNKIFDDNAENLDRPDELKKDYIVEEGSAYGVDFTLKFEYKQFFLWTVYSLSYVDRWDGIQSYRPIFDRRHNANVVGAYKFGKELNWEYSFRWNLGSGFPFTQTQGFYEEFTFQDGLETDYVNENGQLGTQYAGLNEGRLPFYHRLDMTLKRRFVVSEYSIFETNFGITNMYDRENIFYVNRVTGEQVYQLPIMPSLGATLTF